MNKCRIFLKIKVKKVPIWKKKKKSIGYGWSCRSLFSSPQSWGWNSPCGHATCEHDVTWRPVEADNLNVKPMTTFPLVLTPLLVIAFLKHVFIPSPSPAFFLSVTPEQSCLMAERHVECVWSEIYCYNKTDTYLSDHWHLPVFAILFICECIFWIIINITAAFDQI